MRNMEMRNAMNAMLTRFQQLRRKKFVKYGLPFLLLMFCGSFGLERFATLRYEFRQPGLFKEENLKKYGIERKKVTLEEEFEKIQKIDIDSWDNIRGPRPWEEPQQK